MSVKAYLALGSNLGDSKGYLQAAIAQLTALETSVSLVCSSLYKTPPWGKVDQPDFYNCVVLLETSATPHELLAACQAIEQNLQRERKEVWGPRTIDIDIVWYDAQAICTPDLIVPHPYLYQRAFVLIPLSELDDRFSTALARLPRADCETIEKLNWT